MTSANGSSLRVLTWHVHGSYLYYLSHAPHRFYLPVTGDDTPGYGGRAGHFPWPDNVVEVPADRVRELDLDVVLHQSRRNWETDRFEILSDEQRRLPQVYLEHDPPRESPTDTRHAVADEEAVLLVHCTQFNRLMWDNGRTPTAVVEHGVVVPDDARYTGELARGLVVINGLDWRGRRLGLDVFEHARKLVPLDLAGMRSERLGGLGDIPRDRLLRLQTRYRFFFNPIRYTSLGLAVCEAMMLGMPIVGLATTEMVTVVENGVSGYLHTDPMRAIEAMQRLLDDAEEAMRLSEGARATARRRFGIERFARDWDEVLRAVVRGEPPAVRPADAHT